MAALIDTHVGERHVDADGQGLRWDVESICEQLTELGCKIAPATYYEQRSRTLSRQQLRDAELKLKITKVHAWNHDVYGAESVADAQP
jgi:putative transposase